MAALVMPTGVIHVLAVARGLASGESLVPVWTATVTVFAQGAMAAVAAAALGLPVAMRRCVCGEGS